MSQSENELWFQGSLRIKILIAFLTVLLIVLMFPRGESIESDVTVGSIWIQDDLIASTAFPILKNPELYQAEKALRQKSTHRIYIKDLSSSSRSLDSIKKFGDRLPYLLNDDQNKTFLSAGAFKALKKAEKLGNLSSASSFVYDAADKIYRTGLLSERFDRISTDSIAVRDGKFEMQYQKQKFLDYASMQDFAWKLVRSTSNNEELNYALIECLIHFLRPNLVFSSSAYEESVRLAGDKISRYVGIVNENERIVAKHDRITPEVKAKIDSYRVAKSEESGYWGLFSQNIGKFFHILLIISLYGIYIFLFRKKIYGDNRKILLISAIILLISFLTFLVHQMNVKAPVELLIPVAVASMLLTIVFDSRIGFYGTIVVALITGALRGNDYVFTMMSISAGSLAAYTVRDMKNRTQMFRSFFFIQIGYFGSIIAFGFERFDSISQILINFAFAASNSLISPVLTYGLIIFVERSFKITTDLTLLELTDFNRPLLRDLGKNAPGTFTHSIAIGSMVEAAADLIGANSILARVGAYYHDIGKSLEPEIFVENQINGINIHERLEPKNSAKLIIDHVSKGLKLAEEYGLPPEVMDFIPMHQGTIVTYYFYDKAKQIYGLDQVNIDDYRYPGPKPNSKETALVMLADACESAVRSMTEPDAKKIENVINNLFKIRLDDGQLDDSPLTYRDLRKVKDSFLSILVGQHYKRIRYPRQDELENTKVGN